jgi:hypothetical protein
LVDGQPHCGYIVAAAGRHLGGAGPKLSDPRRRCAADRARAYRRSRKAPTTQGSGRDGCRPQGLNLQRLQTLINIDLPWIPAPLEQGKGRIERIGHEAEAIDILNLRYRNSVEDDVHRALSHRLKDIHDVFGTLPDTLEDVWVRAAEGEMEEATRLIDAVPLRSALLREPPGARLWQMREGPQSSGFDRDPETAVVDRPFADHRSRSYEASTPPT